MVSSLVHSLAVFVAVCACTSCASAQDDTLTLAVFISINATFTGGINIGRPFVEAVDLAVDLINNDTDILPGYRLQYELSDAQCGAGPSVRSFIDQIFEEPTKIMIVGADCSTATEPIAELAPFWNLVQISALSSSPALSQTSTYPTFLRVVSSDADAAEGIVSIMQAFNLSRVAVMSQQETIFTSTFSQLRMDLTDANITEDPREFNFNTNDDPRSVVYRLGNSSTRIIFVNMYPEVALEVLCQAYRLGLTHRNGYLWLFHAWYPANWWLAEPASRATYTPILCERDEIEEMIEFAILIDHYASVAEEDRLTVTETTLSPDSFDGIIRTRLALAGVDDTLASQAQFYFDSVWAAALALHTVAQEFNLSAFSYDPNNDISVLMRDSIFDSVGSLDFTGLSGQVRFNGIGDRYPSLNYFQYTRNDLGNVSRTPIQNLTEDIFPLGVPLDEEFVHISLALFVIYTVLALVGVAAAVVCLVLNLYFRNKKVMKLSSPYLNILIVSGIILFYIDVILFGIDANVASMSTVNVLCMTRLWIASISFSLVFGTIFAKTWRVYYIFYSSNRLKRNKKTLIQDWVLFLMVEVLVAVDVVFMVFVTAFPKARLTLTDLELPSNNQDLPQVVDLCRAEDRIIWLSILLAYKGIFLIIGVFLAFETRNVKIRHLRDSKLIGMSVYGILVLSLALTAVSLLLEQYVDTFYAVIGIMVMMGSTALLGLIFIPKFYSLWNDPEGLNLMGGAGDESTAVSKGSMETKEKIFQLNQEIQKLRKELQTQLPTSLNNHDNSIKLDNVSLPPKKSRSERSISFVGISNGQPEDKENVAEISKSFNNHVKNDDDTATP